MVVLDRHVARNILRETPQVGDQATIESQEERCPMVVRSWMSQVKRAVYRHGGLATASSSQHHDMAMRWQVQHFSLTTNGLWQAHGCSAFLRERGNR